MFCLAIKANAWLRLMTENQSLVTSINIDLSSRIVDSEDFMSEFVELMEQISPMGGFDFRYKQHPAIQVSGFTRTTVNLFLFQHTETLCHCVSSCNIEYINVIHEHGYEAVFNRSTKAIVA